MPILNQKTATLGILLMGSRPSINQLCSVDTITVLRSGVSGPTCGLGAFQPVDLHKN